jgi:hypothetical protein
MHISKESVSNGDPLRHYLPSLRATYRGVFGPYRQVRLILQRVGGGSRPFYFCFNLVKHGCAG